MPNETKKFTTETQAALKAWVESTEVKDAIEAITKAAEGDAGTFEMVITTENVDRYGEVIKIDGWNTDHYMKNPVVLWGHDHYTPPIGITTSLEVRDGKLVARGKFAMSEFAQEIRRSYDAGIIRASSVGFIEIDREGTLITKAELIEWSFVSVPANPYALTLAMKSNISVNDLVTKGLLFVDEQFARAATEEVKPEEVPPVVTPEEKTFTHKQISPVIENLKSAISALEVLAKGEEPEGTEDDDEAGEEGDPQKEFDAFSRNRKKLQDVATLVSDVLATARVEAEARN